MRVLAMMYSMLISVMVFVKFLPQEPNIFNQVHCFLGIHCKYSGFYIVNNRKHFPCIYRAKKLKWKFPRTRKYCGHRSCSPVFPQLFKFSQTFLSLMEHFFPQGLGILCSPFHGDVGAVTRTVGLKLELINLIDTSLLKLGISHLGLFQTPLHSCAEPNSVEFELQVMTDSDGVLVLNLIREGWGNNFL